MKLSQLLATIVASILLSACGGGGSGTPGAVAPGTERVGNVPAAVSILPSNAQ